MHVGEFIDGAPGGTDGEVHAFHHAGHDVGGVLETEQRIAEGLDVPDQLVAVRVAGPVTTRMAMPAHGRAARRYPRLPGIVGHIRTAEGCEDAASGRGGYILLGLQEFVAQAEVLVPIQKTLGCLRCFVLRLLVQGVDHLIGQHRTGPLVLEVDHGDVRGLEVLHIFAGRVQHVVDYKIGIERQHVFPKFALLDEGLVIARGDVGGGEFAFFGADRKRLYGWRFRGPAWSERKTCPMPMAG